MLRSVLMDGTFLLPLVLGEQKRKPQTFYKCPGLQSLSRDRMEKGQTGFPNEQCGKHCPGPDQLSRQNRNPASSQGWSAMAQATRAGTCLLSPPPPGSHTIDFKAFFFGGGGNTTVNC